MNTKQEERYKVCISNRDLVPRVVEKLRKLNMVTIVTVEDFEGNILHQYADHPFSLPEDSKRRLCDFMYKYATKVVAARHGNVFVEVPADIITPAAKRIFKLLHFID